MVLPSGRSGGLGIRCPQQISRAQRAFSREAKVAAPRKYSQRGREDSARRRGREGAPSFPRAHPTSTHCAGGTEQGFGFGLAGGLSSRLSNGIRGMSEELGNVPEH